MFWRRKQTPAEPEPVPPQPSPDEVLAGLEFSKWGSKRGDVIVACTPFAKYLSDGGGHLWYTEGDRVPKEIEKRLTNLYNAWDLETRLAEAVEEGDR